MVRLFTHIIGANAQTGHDQKTIMAIIQILETISNDFSLVSSSILVNRVFDVFEKLTITDNTQISSSKIS